MSPPVSLNIVSINALTKPQLRKLSLLHAITMDTLLERLGIAAVRLYYEAAIQDKATLGFVALDSKQEPVGWVVGNPSPYEIFGALRRRLLARPCLLLQRVVFHPIKSAHVILSQVQGGTYREPIGFNEIELVYIGVQTSARGQGLGKFLIDEFLSECKKNGFNRVFLSVEVDNSSALKLYKRLNFKIVRTFSEGVYVRHRMVVEL